MAIELPRVATAVVSQDKVEVPSPPLASQQQPFEGSGAVVAALTAEFAPRRRSELVQGASLATS